MKRKPDRRYYLCPEVGCMGQVAPVLQSKTKEPVYLCSQCGKSFAQAAVA